MSEQLKNGKSKSKGSVADHLRTIDKGLDEMKDGLGKMQEGLEEMQTGVHSLASHLEYVEGEVIRAHTEIDALNDRFRHMDAGYAVGV